MHGGDLVGHGARYGGRATGGVRGLGRSAAAQRGPRTRHRVRSGPDGITVAGLVGLRMSKALLRLLALCAWAFCAPAFAGDTPFDLIIANGHIIDGTGSPWYSADL